MFANTEIATRDLVASNEDLEEWEQHGYSQLKSLYVHQERASKPHERLKESMQCIFKGVYRVSDVPVVLSQYFFKVTAYGLHPAAFTYILITQYVGQYRLTHSYIHLLVCPNQNNN